MRCSTKYNDAPNIAARIIFIQSPPYNAFSRAPFCHHRYFYLHLLLFFSFFNLHLEILSNSIVTASSVKHDSPKQKVPNFQRKQQQRQQHQQQHQQQHLLLLRHCARAPYLNDRHPPLLPPHNLLTNANDYTSKPFPDNWNVKEGECTFVGRENALKAGLWLQSIFGPEQRVVEFIADDVQRCVDTATDLLQGFSGLAQTQNTPSTSTLQNRTVSINQNIFDPLSANLPGCKQPDWVASIQNQMNDEVISESLHNIRNILFPRLQSIITDSPEKENDSSLSPSSSLSSSARITATKILPPSPPKTSPTSQLVNISDEISNDGYLVGGLRVASELMVETFVLQRTSGLEVAWGHFDTKNGDELRELLPIRTIYLLITYGGKDVASRYGSGILENIFELFSKVTFTETCSSLMTPLKIKSRSVVDASISNKKNADKKNAVNRVLVGHDTNIQAVASILNLEWQCGQWDTNATGPLSGLLFSRYTSDCDVVRNDGSGVFPNDRDYESDGRGVSKSDIVEIKAACPTLSGSTPFSVVPVFLSDGSKAMFRLADFIYLLQKKIMWECV